MESDTTAIELLDRLAKTWAKWIGPSGDREQYKRMSQFAADGAAALRERDTLRAELAAARLEIEALRVKPWQEQIEGQSAVISRLRYEKGVAEAEAAALRAHVERLTNQLEALLTDQLTGGRDEGNEIAFDLKPGRSPELVKASFEVLMETPAQSLAACKAEALREAAKECQEVMPDDLPHLTYNQLMEMAERLQAEAANGTT